MMIKNDDNGFSQKEAINNPIYNDDKNYKFEETDIVDKAEHKNNEIKNTKKEKLNFWNFLIYKITFGKRNNI